LVLNKRTVDSLIKAGAFDGVGHPRKALCLQFETLLEATIERRRNEEMGQYSLFGGEQSEDEQPKVAIEGDEWAQKMKLAFEREMLGLYVSDHPLLALGPTLKALGQPIAGLVEQHDRTNVTIGGLVGSITRRFTKKGELMLFFQLEDLEGSVEVVAFPGVVNGSGALVAEDAVLVVRGHLDHRGDDVKVIAKEITELSFRPTLEVRLEVPARRLSTDLVAKLKDILSHHPGSAPVFLHMVSDDKHKVLKLSDSHRVEPRSALYAELRELLGHSAVI
jgi:DNA polymerase-3 subunit alpha